MLKKESSKYEIPHLSQWNFLTKHKTKTIESRKLLIEEFLQKVLSNFEIV